MDDESGVRALQVLHEVIKRVHASLDLRSTLDEVARGVTAATEFQVACLNLLMPDGYLEIVAVAGSPEVSEALLGMRESEENVRKVLDLSEPWGQLRFVDHTIDVDGLLDNTWVPPIGVGADEDAWHPEDMLLAVLTAPTGEWLGMLSVDLPASRKRPDALTRQLLEIFADHAAIAIMHARLHERVLASEMRMEHAATHDALTGLGNRALLAAHEQVTADPAQPVAVVTIDLDEFKTVNDAHGHAAGDEVLRVVATRLKACVRDRDLVARTGGDEFLIVLTSDVTEDLLPALVERLTACLAEPISAVSGTHRVGASIGAALSTTDTTLTELAFAADRRMYERKHANRPVRGETEPGSDPDRQAPTGDPDRSPTVVATG